MWKFTKASRVCWLNSSWAKSNRTRNGIKRTQKHKLFSDNNNNNYTNIWLCAFAFLCDCRQWGHTNSIVRELIISKRVSWTESTHFTNFMRRFILTWTQTRIGASWSSLCWTFRMIRPDNLLRTSSYAQTVWLWQFSASTRLAHGVSRFGCHSNAIAQPSIWFIFNLHNFTTKNNNRERANNKLLSR